MKVIHKFEHVANLLDKQGRLKNEIYCKMKEMRCRFTKLRQEYSFTITKIAQKKCLAKRQKYTKARVTEIVVFFQYSSQIQKIKYKIEFGPNIVT